MRSSFLAFLALVVVAAGCEVVTPSNPFDPATPGLQQAPGSIIGTLVLVDEFDDDDLRALQLETVRVGLFDEEGRRLERDGVAIENALNNVDGAAGSGTFAFDGLVPGVYTPAFVVPVGYANAGATSVRLLPGATIDIGEVVFTDEPDDAGPGTISGDVAFDGGGDGARTISLFSRSEARGVRLAQSIVSADGTFSFSGLEVGSYAVVAEGSARTPAYRLDILVADGAGGGSAALSHSFSGDSRIVLHPLTTAALPLPSPSVLLDDGTFYVRDAAVTLAILSASAVADVGATGMRIGFDETFVDVDGSAIPFSPYAATSDVSLPAREGRIALFVQLEAKSPGGFAFTSPAFTTSVVRDATAPAVLAARVGGVDVDDNGVFLSPARALTIELDGVDDTSGVDRIATVLADVEPTELVFDDVTVAAGLARFSRSLGAVADGPSKVFIRLRDKAGNESPTTVLDVIVDESPPDVALVVDNAPGGTLGSRLARVSFTPNAAVDAPVALQLRVQGGVFSPPEPFVGDNGAAVVVVDPALGGHGDTIAI